jgi:hypothetical protein
MHLQGLHGGHAFQSTLDRLIVAVDSSSITPASPLEGRIALYRQLRTATPTLVSVSTSRSNRPRGASFVYVILQAVR